MRPAAVAASDSRALACHAPGAERDEPFDVDRRTYASRAHQQGVPDKVLAELLGHERVDTSVNVYSQVIDGAKRAAAQQVGGELKSKLITIDHAGLGTQESTL